MNTQQDQKFIYVYADWISLNGSTLMGTLNVSISRGKEIFYFTYDNDWLRSATAQVLDPDLGLYSGPQYLSDGKGNFGLFLDSSPDRWGRMLMKRREAARARKEGCNANKLYESDFLLGVFDGHRMGALRFKLDQSGDFLDNNSINASPPWTKLRDLEFASMHIEEDDDSLDLNLAIEVAEYFRVDTKESNEIITFITSVVKKWRSVATETGISKSEQELMSNAFGNIDY